MTRTGPHPFGEAIVTGSASLDARLPGQWFQLETGLSWNWHRTYDPAIGRYIQPDPLGLADGPSLYGYAGTNPLKYTDPSCLTRNLNPDGDECMALLRKFQT